MTQTSTDVAPGISEAQRHLVEVTMETTNEDGETQTTTLTIESGSTKVTALKAEAGIAEADPLWVIRKDGKRKQLGDHETHDVKEGDRYQALVKGGVS